MVSGSVCPTDAFLEANVGLSSGQALIQGDELLAFKGEKWEDEPSEIIPFSGALNLITRPWDIWSKNVSELNLDFIYSLKTALALR